MKKIFCPCPWTGMYVHLKKTLPCPFNKHGEEYSPLEYMESDFVKDLRKSFSEGKFHTTCEVCQKRERAGLNSGRLTYLKKYNDTKDSIRNLEVRFSNLCNFKCRMCEPNSSSEIAREQVINIEQVVYNIEEDYIDELKKIICGVEILTLTGGEPFLIKKYYELIDYLVESGHSNHISLIVYTNGSVYNNQILDRMKHFKNINLVISLDGVGKTAEYIRSGTKWFDVDSNIIKFLSLPFDITIHTTLQSYALFDLFNLCKYLKYLRGLRNNLCVKVYTIVYPKPLRPENIKSEHRNYVIQQIDESINILIEENFKPMLDELNIIKRNISFGRVVDYESFVEFTERYDSKRNEKFEDVFGFTL